MIDPMPAKDMNAAADLWAQDGTVEWTAAGRTVAATSRPYRLDQFVVLTVRDGLIDSLEIDSVDGKVA
ncbi:hypothetical protein KVH22_27855 [Streptomyces olivaceus]|uniref:hypothetical protein n=1 Tax=Streptomyces TaxID=1883 RepID=UPI001CCDDAD5|nr:MULTISPECIES: hypothetical protein [Streptomyces]MBZ6259332.1 hypothetical protein [Streptomyces olivaceus]WFB83318.1 hypothetical protein MMU79_08260 [Streptomyces olivaceus]WGK45619.1 hypothetical protein M6G09_08280 [Streptomyces sp. B146]